MSHVSLETAPRVVAPVVDPRGLRFAAALTTVVLAVVLVSGSPLREIVLACQVAVFALGAFVSLGATPWAWAFRTVVRPRLAPPAALEDAGPPRFAQIVGFSFTAVALAGFLAGLPLLGLIATAAAFVAALLNAATGFCLGCELYLLTRRVASRAHV